VRTVGSEAQTGERVTPPARDRVRARALWIAGTLAAAVVLMLAYLAAAGTVPVLSDGAGNALQAWDMLHGNLLLHGWWVTDVSFYTTELPQYMLIEAFGGLRTEVVHIAAAMTYTMLALLAAFVARGRARGTEGIVRALLAAGIMLAPQPLAPTWILMSSPDHVGAAVPVLVLLLILDWARPRWYIPVIACVLLAWATVGDPVTLIVGVAPLALACALRAVRGLARREGLRAVWYELSLAAAAVIAVGLTNVANHLVRSLGGFTTNPGVSKLVPLAVVSKNVSLGVQSFLAIFGADFAAVHGLRNETFAALHLAGVVLVLAAVVVAAWRLLRYLGGRSDLVVDVLVIAVVANVAGYFLGFRIPNIYAAHEIGPVLALGAALAGRTLGGAPRLWTRAAARLRSWLLPAFAAGLACYAVMLGFAATRAQTPPSNAALSGWLTSHGLHSGLAGYWQGTSVTLDTGGRIDMVSVVEGKHGKLAPRHWEADMRLTDASTHNADFVVVVPGGVIDEAQAVRSFGRPARVYQDAGDTILVWHKNLLPELGPSAA
jgi:hypothetical protein